MPLKQGLGQRSGQLGREGGGEAPLIKVLPARASSGEVCGEHPPPPQHHLQSTDIWLNGLTVSR